MPTPEQMAKLAEKMPGGMPGLPGALPARPGLPPTMPGLPPKLPGGLPGLGGKLPGGLPGWAVSRASARRNSSHIEQTKHTSKERNRMSLKIRMARAGTKKRPVYHIVVADSR